MLANWYTGPIAHKFGSINCYQREWALTFVLHAYLLQFATYNLKSFDTCDKWQRFENNIFSNIDKSHAYPTPTSRLENSIQVSRKFLFKSSQLPSLPIKISSLLSMRLLFSVVCIQLPPRKSLRRSPTRSLKQTSRASSCKKRSWNKINFKQSLVFSLTIERVSVFETSSEILNEFLRLLVPEIMCIVCILYTHTFRYSFDCVTSNWKNFANLLN